MPCRRDQPILPRPTGPQTASSTPAPFGFQSPKLGFEIILLCYGFCAGERERTRQRGQGTAVQRPQSGPEPPSIPLLPSRGPECLHGLKACPQKQALQPRCSTAPPLRQEPFAKSASVPDPSLDFPPEKICTKPYQTYQLNIGCAICLQLHATSWPSRAELH
jgi:hypothetical protein